jgi:UDP-2,3-diacylglucosamine pyrophosphatase LpxH
VSAPRLLLSDVHLSATPNPQREAALETLLRGHPAHDVVFLGDLFEFASTKARAPDAALDELWTVNRRFGEALREHAKTGARVHWVAGNHDAALSAVSDTTIRATGIALTIWPWFLRWGDIHLEHGHLFDRDNAPLHPLERWDIRDEPLGVALMRRIVVELDVPMWAHAHQTTPAQALAQAQQWFGWRLPLATSRAFTSLLGISLRAVAGRWGRVNAARDRGRTQLAAYAARSGVSEDALIQLLLRVPLPTHARGRTTFRRLYLDWVSAVSLLVAGGVTGAAVGGVVPWVAAMVGGGYALREGYFRRESRYPGPLEALRKGAHLIAQHTGARRVIFGHTHVEEDDGLYANLGSFGFPNERGRAFALLTESGTFTRRHLPAGYAP